MANEIAEYIRQNRAVYTREAIDQALLNAGHAPADIEAAWQAAGPEPVPEPPSRPEFRQWGDDEPSGLPPRKQKVTGQPVFWLALVGFVVVFCGLGSGSGIFGFYLPGLQWLVLALPVAALIAGAMLLRRNRPLGMGLLYGVVVAVLVPVVVFLVLAGICLVTGTTL